VCARARVCVRVRVHVCVCVCACACVCKSMCVAKETYTYGKKSIHETERNVMCVCRKRDVHIHVSQKRRVSVSLQRLFICIHMKRDLHIRQKETLSCVCVARGTCTYMCHKRDVYQCRGVYLGVESIYVSFVTHTHDRDSVCLLCRSLFICIRLFSYVYVSFHMYTSLFICIRLFCDTHMCTSLLRHTTMTEFLSDNTSVVAYMCKRLLCRSLFICIRLFYVQEAHNVRRHVSERNSEKEILRYCASCTYHCASCTYVYGSFHMYTSLL